MNWVEFASIDSISSILSLFKLSGMRMFCSFSILEEFASSDSSILDECVFSDSWNSLSWVEFASSDSVNSFFNSIKLAELIVLEVIPLSWLLVISKILVLLIAQSDWILDCAAAQSA